MNESNEYVLPIDVSMVCHQTGFEQLGDKDLDECFLYFGSFLSMTAFIPSTNLSILIDSKS